MALMRWLEWEENGYSDSDFYQAVWNTETGQADAVLIGSTRFAGGYSQPECVPWTPEELERARLWLRSGIFSQLRKAEDKDVLEPDTVSKGDRVRLVEQVRNMAKDAVTAPCDRCEGSGKWVNPNNAADVRECFACKGKGERVLERKRSKDAGGKQRWNVFEPGLAGKVVWTGTYRQIYGNGYNRLNRRTLTVRVLLDDGREVQGLLEKFRLDKEPESDEQIMERADHLSRDMNCKPLLSGHGGWLSNNWAVAASRTPAVTV